jgi:ABC-2 type transport system permease protein
MTRLLSGELIKVRTTRTALGFGLAAVLLVLAVTLITILANDLVGVAQKRDALNFGGVIAIVLLLFGAVGATGEFRHRTIAPAVLIAPDRFRIVVARIAAYGLTALLFGVVMGIIAIALGLMLLGGEPGPDLAGSDYVRLAAGGLIAAVLATTIGVGIGTLVRNQVAAVVGILVWVTILEPLSGLVVGDLSKYWPVATLVRVGRGGDDEMSMGVAVLVLLGWAVVACAAGALVDRRRDVD